MYKPDNQGSATIRAPHSADRPLFKSPILSHLPELSNRQPSPFELPAELPTALTAGKSLGVICCAECSRQRELDGYIFKLVPVCGDCRTERSLEILANQRERRTKNR